MVKLIISFGVERFVVAPFNNLQINFARASGAAI